MDRPPLDAGDPIESNRPPVSIGRYRVLGELGRGGMGVVYLGEDPSLGREVAIKTLPASVSNNPEAYARFEKEARILAALSHLNIAIIYSLESTESRPFLTMERIHGRTLAQALAETGRYDQKETVRIGVAISRALEAAHDRDVIHRDLKPGNVMIRDDGEVKVLDFGLATDLQADSVPRGGEPVVPSNEGADPSGVEDSVDTMLTSSTTGAGTPGYMSPEQIRGEPLDPRSDLFALGCVLYECYTGAPVIGGDTPAHRAVSTLDEERDLSRLEGLPPRVSDAVARCLDPDPTKRPSGAREVRRILEETLEQWTVERLARHARDPGTRGTGTETEGERGNLPQTLSSFIGRRSVVESVTRSLTEHRLVTLTGAGGSGKTRVAIEAARALASAYEDGAWWVELAAVTDERLLEKTLMSSLGIEEVSGQPARDAVVRYLSGRQILVVLDNCEHLVAACANLVHAILSTGARTRVLATSRELLGVAGETRLQVPPLEVPDPSDALSLVQAKTSEAVSLFEARARQARPDFAVDDRNLTAVLGICRRLDGLPLALELAASRMRVLSPEEILARLDDRFRLLTGGSRGRLAHQRTLRASIEWSHDQLGETESTLFRRLSVFVAGWTLDAAESVCNGDGLEGWEILDALTQLLDKSLVDIAPGCEGEAGASPRYRMLETVRAFAAEELESSGEVARTRDRFVAYVRDFAVETAHGLVGPEAGSALARLRADYGNIREAILRSLELEDARPALVLTGGLLRYWLMDSFWNEGSSFVLQAVAHPGADAHPFDLGAALNSAGALLTRAGDAPASIALLERAEALFLQLGDHGAAAKPTMNLGNAHAQAGQFERALDCHERVLATARELGNQWLTAAALTNLSNVCDALGHVGRLGEVAAEAAQIFETLGDRANLIMATNYRGLHAFREERHEEAIAFFDRGLALAGELGDRYWAAMLELHRSVALIGLQDYDRASVGVQAALQVAHELDEPMLTLAALEAVVNVAADRGDHRSAATLASAIDALRDRLPLPRRTVDDAGWSRLITRLREALGSEAYTSNIIEGSSLTMSQAVELARSTA